MAERVRRLAVESTWCVLAGMLVLAALEALLRLGDDFGRNGPEQIRRTTLDGDPVYTGRPWFPREFSTRVRSNAEAYHAAEFTPVPGRPDRIAVIGDSYVKALQLAREQNLVARAEEIAPKIQFLGLGGSAQFFPRQATFFRDEFPILFGPEGRYPPVDGVVFCIRAHSVRHVAEGSVAYAGFPAPRLPWTHRLKSRGHPDRRELWRRGLRSGSHAVSLLSSRIHDWLEADLRRELPVPTPARVEQAHRLMITRALLPTLELAAAREVPVGFLYLPSVSEALGSSSRAERQIHRLWIESLRELGVPLRDASTQLTTPAALFFPGDRHPNAAGHRVFGARLAALASEMLGRD